MNDALDYAFVDRTQAYDAVYGRRRLHPARLVLWGVVALFAAWFVLQNNARKTVVENLAQAVQSRDSALFEQKADWPALRKMVAGDLQQRAIGNDSLPQKADFIRELVDYYLQPTRMPELIDRYNRRGKSVAPADFVRAVYPSGLAEVTVEIRPPARLDRPWASQLEPVRLVYHLQNNGAGLRWQVTQMHVPDYLIPTRLPARP